MFKMFKVGELFDIHPTTAYKMKNDELFASDGATPVLSNSSVNNGKIFATMSSDEFKNGKKTLPFHLKRELNRELKAL